MTILAVLMYGVGTLIFVIFGGIIVYHLRRYGFMGDATKFMVAIYIIVSVLIIVSSSIFVARTDWGTLNLGPITPSAPTDSQTPIFGN